MNVKDKLIETICSLIDKEDKQKLHEFSMSKQYIINRLYDMSLVINEHLICCYFWNNTENYNHWKTEISSFIRTLPKVKGTNKYPTEKQLKRWVINNTVEEIKEKIDGIIKRTEQDENVKITDYDKTTIQNYLIDFWNWLASYLADGNDVMPNDIQNKVDQLVEQYKNKEKILYVKYEYKNLINKAQSKNLITTYKDFCKTKLGKQTQLTKQEIDYYKKICIK